MYPSLPVVSVSSSLIFLGGPKRQAVLRRDVPETLKHYGAFREQFMQHLRLGHSRGLDVGMGPVEIWLRWLWLKKLGFTVDITTVNGGYKPTYNLGGTILYGDVAFQFFSPGKRG